MAKLSNQYMVVKLSKAVKDSAPDELHIDEDLKHMIVEAIEKIIESSGETGIIVEIETTE